MLRVGAACRYDSLVFDIKEIFMRLMPSKIV
jgi:hypothetical protein